ncbi:MAG TPA: glutathione-disulfide reductase, partial [Stellaceae bacterium]|nr:glutathione-disulfide reductase [Stellaceae bacterium]
DFDMFTIGAGSGGVASSRRAGSHGARVAICEDSRVGGTCVIRGCVPKKLLVYGAQFADAFADAEGFGWHVPPPTHDWASLIAAKDREIDRLEGIYRKLLDTSKVALIEGRGRLIDPHTVEVEERRFTAAHILIAAGGHPELPAIPGIEHAITSNEALDLPLLPRQVVIVGGGYIAVEFAGIFQALGAAVTLVIRGEALLKGFDEDVRHALGEELRARGITIRAHSQVTSIEKTVSGVRLHLAGGEVLAAGAVLYATGRGPNTRGLGLEESGVRLDAASGAVLVDEWSRSSVPHIFAVGDVTDRMNLTPVAIAEGRALAETLFNRNPMKLDRTNIATAVFSQPPVGTVGLTEAEARARYGVIDIYRARFRPMKHTLSGREERTMMKLVVDRLSDIVLGCHMVGVDAPEIIQGLAVALKCGATKRQFDETVGIHPTAAEEFVTMRDKVPDPVAAAVAE